MTGSNPSTDRTSTEVAASTALDAAIMALGLVNDLAVMVREDYRQDPAQFARAHRAGLQAKAAQRALAALQGVPR